MSTSNLPPQIKSNKFGSFVSKIFIAIPHFLARQASKPEGFFGKLFGSAMKKMNHDSNKWVLSMFNVNVDDRVLEIGYGPGDGINQLTKIVKTGLIAGVDSSATMHKAAVSKNEKYIVQGLVELSIGNADKLPYPDNFFDKLFCVHVMYFWKDPIVELKEIYRTAKPGGNIAIFIGKKEEMQEVKLTQTGVYKLYSGADVKDLLKQSGFSNIFIFEKKIAQGPINTGICILAEKQS